jgi:hypothetical protein
LAGKEVIGFDADLALSVEMIQKMCTQEDVNAAHDVSLVKQQINDKARSLHHRSPKLDVAVRKHSMRYEGMFRDIFFL